MPSSSPPGSLIISQSRVQENRIHLTRTSQAAFISHRRSRERWVGLEQLGLRDHVAQVHSAAPAELAPKGAKFIRASQAWLETLEPAPRIRIDYQGPVMVLGGGGGACRRPSGTAPESAPAPDPRTKAPGNFREVSRVDQRLNQAFDDAGIRLILTFWGAYAATPVPHQEKKAGSDALCR